MVYNHICLSGPARRSPASVFVPGAGAGDAQALHGDVAAELRHHHGSVRAQHRRQCARLRAQRARAETHRR